MQKPQELGDYFSIVEDFLSKTFRDDCKLFFAIRSEQASTLRMTSSASSSLNKQQADGDSTNNNKNSATTLHNVRFSPRLFLFDDNATFGKLKIGAQTTIPQICESVVNLIISSDGVTRAKLSLDGMRIEGLSLDGSASYNFIESGSKDVVACAAKLLKKNFYAAAEVERNGLGSWSKGLELGTSFYNVILGCGLRHRSVSLVEEAHRTLSESQHDSQGDYEDQSLFIGAGMHGKNWSYGGRMLYRSEAWDALQFSMYRQVGKATSVACNYILQLLDRNALVTVGAAQAFHVYVPSFLVPQGEAGEQQQDRSTRVPFVGAMKGDTAGNVSIAVRGQLNSSLEWSVVAKKNVLNEGERFRYGVQLTLSDD
jgi:hypothetical protein